MKQPKLDYTLPEKPMTVEDILKRLIEIEKDEILWYPVANVFSNAPLALIQVSLSSEAKTLRQVLGLPKIQYYEKINS